MRSKTIYSSTPTTTDQACFKADAQTMIKAKLEVDFTVDPRKPMNCGQLAALCRGLEICAHKRAEFSLPTGEVLDLMAVSAREAAKGGAWTYIGNEVRLGDRCVAQRLRSPESSLAFKGARTPQDRFTKEANLMLANWRDETVVDRETARRLVVLAFPADMTAGVAYKLSWYVRDHGVAGMPGYVDLRPALTLVADALDKADAEATAKADAEAKARAEAVEVAIERHDATVAELRERARALGLAGVTKLRKAELVEAIVAAVTPEPTEITVSAAEMKGVAIALNLASRDGGAGRLRLALKAAGIRIDLGGLSPEAQLEKLVQAAKKCRVGDQVEA